MNALGSCTEQRDNKEQSIKIEMSGRSSRCEGRRKNFQTQHKGERNSDGDLLRGTDVEMTEVMSALQGKADGDTQKLLSFNGECLQLASRVRV